PLAGPARVASSPSDLSDGLFLLPSKSVYHRPEDHRRPQQPPAVENSPQAAMPSVTNLVGRKRVRSRMAAAFTSTSEVKPVQEFGAQLRPQAGTKWRVKLKLQRLKQQVVIADSPSTSAPAPEKQQVPRSNLPEHLQSRVWGQQIWRQEQQQQQDKGGERGSGRMGDLRWFFTELNDMAAGLPPQEALAALETCAVAGALPLRATFEALLRSVRRAATSAAAVQRPGSSSWDSLQSASCSSPEGGLYAARSSRTSMLPPTRVVAVLHGFTLLGQRLSQTFWRDLLSYLQPYLSSGGTSSRARGNVVGAAAAPVNSRRYPAAPLNLYDLVDLAVAMASAGCNPSTPFLEAHAAAVMSWMGHLTGRQAARLLWSYASLDYRPPTALQKALAALLHVRSAEVDVGDLARGVQALALLAAAAASPTGGRIPAVAARKGGAVWAAGVSSSDTGAEGRVGGGGLASYILDVAAECVHRHHDAFQATLGISNDADETLALTGNPPRMPQEQHEFLSWLLVAAQWQVQAPALLPDWSSDSGDGQSSKAVEVTCGGGDATGRRPLPPLQGSLCADSLATVSRLILFLLLREPGMTATDESWALHYLHQVTLLAPFLRPVDLVPTAKLVCHLYESHPTLLGRGAPKSASEGLGGKSSGGSGGPLQALVASACSSIECLSYGQSTAMYGSIAALAAKPQVQEQLYAWTALGLSAKSSHCLVAPDILLLTRAAPCELSRVASSTSTSTSSGGNFKSCARTAAAVASAVRVDMHGDGDVVDPAGSLRALLRGPSGEEAAGRQCGWNVAARGLAPELVAGFREEARSTWSAVEVPSGLRSGGAVAASRRPATSAAAASATGAGVVIADEAGAALDPSVPAAATPLKRTAAMAEEAAAVTVAATQLTGGIPGMAAALHSTEYAGAAAVGATTVSSELNVAGANSSIASRLAPQTWTPGAPPGAFAFLRVLARSTPQRRDDGLVLLAPPRRPLQNNPRTATSAAAAAAIPAPSPVHTGPPNPTPVVMRDLPSSADAEGNNSAAVNGALQALALLLRSFAEARVPLPVQQLQEVQIAWRRHLHSASLNCFGPANRGGCSTRPPSVADVRVVAELLLAVAAAAPRQASARRTAVLELATTLGASGAVALRSLPPMQLTACVHAVALAASGDGGDGSDSSDDRGRIRRIGQEEMARKTTALVRAMEPLLEEFQRRMAPSGGQPLHQLLPPQCVAVVCRALSHLSYGPIWPARLRRYEATVAAATKAQLATATLSPYRSASSSPSAGPHLRRAIAAYLPPLTAAAAPPPSVVRYGVWVLRHLDLQVGRNWLERLCTCAPRYLRRMHPRATADWLAGCAARCHAPPRPAMRRAWLHLYYTWRLLNWHELYEVVWSAVRLGLRPPRFLLAAACQSVAAAAAAAAGTVAATAGLAETNALHGDTAGGALITAVAAGGSDCSSTPFAEPVADGGMRRRALDPGGGSGDQRTGGCKALQIASISVRLLWAVQQDERYTPTPQDTAALCSLMAVVWGDLAASERTAALWALASLPPLSSSERAVLESGLGDVVVRHLLASVEGSDAGGVSNGHCGEAEVLTAVDAAASGGPEGSSRLEGGAARSLSAPDMARLVWALSRLRQPLPQQLSEQLCAHLAVALTAAEVPAGSTLPMAMKRAMAAPIMTEVAYTTATAVSTKDSHRAGLRPKEVVQALYGAARLLLGACPAAAGAPAVASLLRPLLRATLATDPALLDARSLADALGTLSRFRRVLAHHRPSDHPFRRQSSLEGSSATSISNQNPDGNQRKRRPAPSGAAVSGDAGCWGNDPWVVAALERARELFEQSAARGLGDRPVPAWCALEVLQGASFLRAPLSPKLAAATSRLLMMHLPGMAPAQLADVLGCCAAHPSLPVELAWEAFQQLVRVETQLAAARGVLEPSCEAAANASTWPPLQPDELARAVMGAPQAMASLVSGHTGQALHAHGIPESMGHDNCDVRVSNAPNASLALSQPEYWAEREVWLPPPLQQRRLLAAAVAELACRPDDPRVASMTPDQLSMLVQGVVAAGAAPGVAWLGWVCGLMQPRLKEASQHGLLRMCKALEVAEMWPGQAWAQACLEQASNLVKARRMLRATERQIHLALLRLRALGAATTATTRKCNPSATRAPAADAATTATASLHADALVALDSILPVACVPVSSRADHRIALAKAAVDSVHASCSVRDGNCANGTGSDSGALIGQLRSTAQMGDLVGAEARRAQRLVYGLHDAFAVAVQLVLTRGGVDGNTLGGPHNPQQHTASWVSEEEKRLPQRPTSDAFSQLLLVYRLAEARMDKVMGLSLKVAALQFAYALQASNSRQHQHRNVLLQRTGPRGLQGPARRMDALRNGFDQRDDTGAEDCVSLVRAQATESTLMDWGFRGGAVKSGQVREGGGALSPRMSLEHNNASLWDSARSLLPLATYLREQQMAPPLWLGRCSEGKVYREQLQVHAVAGEQEVGHPRPSVRGRVGGLRGDGRGAARADGSGSLEGGDILACIVHAKYCGLLHMFSKSHG
ncbi:hypothetical protein Vafri_18460, partial [Volvox africanus]